MWNRAGVKSVGLARFKMNYWKCVLVALILGLISGGGASAGSSTRNSVNGNSNYGGLPSFDERMMAILGIVAIAAFFFVLVMIALSIFVFNPLMVGCQRFFLVNLNEEAQYREMKVAFSGNYWNVVKTIFLQDLFIFLWSLLFVIPGIIKSYEYRMIPYLLAENPNLSREEAFAISKQMMTGNKWDAFVLDLSFIGWHLLAILTCGILEIFYVAPYQHSTNAALFQALRMGNMNQQTYQNNEGYVEVE